MKYKDKKILKLENKKKKHLMKHKTISNNTCKCKGR